jgi:acyl-coenzyme A thioesterase PaaI-like protein
MQPFTNDYGYIHWWYTFYLLDKSSHKFAIDKIWECLTANANIYYHNPILPSDIENIKITHKTINQTKKTILIQSQILVKKETMATAMLTFIKK